MKIESTLDPEKKLDDIVQVGKSLNKQFRGFLTYSIEVPGTDDPYIVFTQNDWDRRRQDIVKAVCDEFNRDYLLMPLDGKIGVRIS